MWVRPLFEPVLEKRWVKGKITVSEVGSWKEKKDSLKRARLGLRRTEPQELGRILCTDVFHIQSIQSLECLSIP